MKERRHLFFSYGLCTGCRLCELICSQVNAREYDPNQSIIHILSHPDLGSHLVSIRRAPCLCPKGEEACVEICNVGSIRFVEDNDTPAALKDMAWMAAPVFE